MNDTQLSPLVSDDQRRRLDEDGFFITDVLFDEETLAGVRSEFERVWHEQIEDAQGHDALTQELARYRPFMSRLHAISPACKAFCRHPVFLQLCRELLGPDADSTWNQAILKPPAASDNTFAWHQDQWYALHGDYAKDSNLDLLKSNETSFTTWVAISRTTVDNGTLWVLPGRHKEGLLPHVWSEERREWVGQFDTSWKIPAVMQAGQMLVFRKYLPHGSGPNVSQEIRMAYQIGYSVPGVKLGPSPDVMPVLRDDEAV
jgi:ectoine hydroxylase-related dioxygenase (phytanoyl-CoA dioxygenase family)